MMRTSTQPPQDKRETEPGIVRAQSTQTVAWLDQLEQGLCEAGRVVMITQVAVKGSAPQACGARVIVSQSAVTGTIGGGQLEHRAIELARSWLQQGAESRRSLDSVALGGRLGQCCGGRVRLLYEMLDAEDLVWVRELQQAAREGASFARLDLANPDATRQVCTSEDDVPSIAADAGAMLSSETLYERLSDPRTPLLVFGAGHVGQALVTRLAGLPFSVHWLDSREAVQPVPPQGDGIATAELGADPLYEINQAPAKAFYLILTHSHAEDFEILSAVLARGDAAWVGLIGSDTKWRGFVQRLTARGVPAQQIGMVHCPIGLPGITGKQPEVIAASVVAQLLLSQTPAIYWPVGSSAHAHNEQETFCDV